MQVPTQITWLDILLKNVAWLSGARSEVRILHTSFLLSTAFGKFFHFPKFAATAEPIDEKLTSYFKTLTCSGASNAYL